MALGDTLSEKGEVMAHSGMLYVCPPSRKLLPDTILPALSEERTEPAQFLLLSILGICTTPWKNSGTSWVLVADISLFIMTL